MLDQDGRNVEPELAGQVLGDGGLAGLQRKAGRRPLFGPERYFADDIRSPADAGTDQQLLAVGDRLEHLGLLDPQTFRHQRAGAVEKGVDIVRSKRLLAEFGNGCLLP